ncbi:MAG: WxL protein peptidoglycan domain-containing protein [Acidimicrobiales bacterium]
MSTPAAPAPRRPLHLARVVMAGLLLLTLLALGGGGLARAQDAPAGSDDPLAGSDSPTAKGPAKNEWALTPTGDNPAEPGSRPNLSYELAPGATVHDSVTVWNYSDQQLAFRIYARDAFNTPSGGFDLLRRDQQSTDAGSWITLEQNSMIVPPHSGIASAITVTVPAEASPGDHAAGIVAAVESPSTSGSGGDAVLVEHRAGSRVYVRVAGPINPSLVIDSLHAQYHRSLGALAGGDLDLAYTVRNSGNVRLSAHQVLEAAGPLGIGLGDARPDDVPELLPGSSITLTGKVSGVLPLVRVTGTVKLEPFSADATVDPPPESVSRSAPSWAIPWLWLALLVVAVIVFRVLRRRLRRRSAGPGGTGGGRGPSDSPDGPAGGPVEALVDSGVGGSRSGAT